MHEELPFEPCPFLHHPHYQTILSTFFSLPYDPPFSEEKRLLLPDGDCLSYVVTTPKGWGPKDVTVILVHGLCGSHKSPNVVRMARCLAPLGIRVIRYNMRGCGSGRGLSKGLCHSGRSEDLFAVLKASKEEFPESPHQLIGFSLGGNIVLKMAGELQEMGKLFLEKVIAVSPPTDLCLTIHRMGAPENEMFESYFYRLMREDILYIHKKHRDLGPIQLPRSLKMYELDQLYIAPRSGFRDAKDYYDKCSSIHFISDISIPTKILLAEDDPIIPSYSLDQQELPSNVKLYKTRRGGHLGYIGNPFHKRGMRWLDSLLLDWLFEQ